MRKLTGGIAIFVLILLVACGQPDISMVRDDFGRYYDSFQVKGSFALYDPQERKYIFYRKKQYYQPFTPASTFKICNSLIGLETGVIKDEHHLIPWDSVVRNPVWDKDHDMKTAFANSTVWYYQELARRVGGEKMKYWLSQSRYGNADTTGGIDQFWLSGGLRITPEQQLLFLQDLREERLPFSHRNMEIVKRIMIEKDSSGHVLRGKTGWGSEADQEIGWYLGYVEIGNKVYYFSNCVQAPGSDMNDVEKAIRFDRSRTEIVYLILQEMGIWNR